jgi:hypothetical protein
MEHGDVKQQKRRRRRKNSFLRAYSGDGQLFLAGGPHY